MRHLPFALLALSVLCAAAFADVGPPPAEPEITVLLQKNGAAYANIDSVTYHCDGSNSTDTGSVSQRTLNITCYSGSCSNRFDWFYKFNPCYYSSGFLSYDYGGKQMDTAMLDFTEKGAYTITVDVETGNTQRTFTPATEPGPDMCCLSYFALVLPLAAALFAGRR